ncbi:MAG TPA: aegerolysin family protein [Thermoanaerobaculia bacterium]|nr:aegerolysin family protein [Thermoanaerobaculia bacterium]
MSTEPITAAAANLQDPQPNYEYLQVQATVINFLDQEMVLTGSDLSWGKWMSSPVNVPKSDTSNFSSQGRDSSWSGTEGWVTWKVGGATIKVTFSSPYSGDNTQGISCTPDLFDVKASGTQGHINNAKFTIKPKK